MARTLERATSTPFMEGVAASNIAINGGMEVSQESGTTQLTLTNNAATKWIVDQWGAAYSHAAATAVFKAQQVTPPGSPSFGLGFPNCLQLTATTLSAMAGAGDYAFLTASIEGYRVAKLGFGSAVNPQYLTIGFWVYATIAGTMAVALQNSANNRSYVTNVVINSALTWEYKTVTIPVDTAGTWLKDNGVGLKIIFDFGAGSTFQVAANAWQASNSFATSSTTNFFASTNNTACITGVGVWPGTDAPVAARSPFAQRPLDEELNLCQRYLYKTSSNGVTLCIMSCYNTTLATGGVIKFPRPMRTAPSFAVSAASDFAVLAPGGGNISCTVVAQNGASVDNSDIRGTVAAGLTAAQAWDFSGQNANARLVWDARLT